MKLERAWMAVLTIGGLLAVLPATAFAKPAAPTTASSPATAACPTPALFTALAAFGDTRSYALAPGGDFEAPAWTLAGGATLTSGNGPLTLGAARSSLQLPPGGSATSPVFCVDLDYPILRFFSTQRAPKSSSKLNVDIVYPALGTGNPKAANLPKGTSEWALSPDVRLRPDRVDSAGGWRQVQVRFSADKAQAGDWRVDDVLVDPRMRG
jgi:hypothetical protein